MFNLIRKRLYLNKIEGLMIHSVTWNRFPKQNLQTCLSPMWRKVTLIEIRTSLNITKG